MWGNTKIDNLQRLLIIQKRCARVTLNAGTERSVGLFKRLGWIPISDIIEQRKLCIMHNIIHGKCPDYYNHYIRYVKNRHHYATRASTNMDLSTPLFSTMTGKRSFLSSGTRLWNNQDSATRVSVPFVNSKINYTEIYRYIDRNSRVDNFTISRNF